MVAGTNFSTQSKSEIVCFRVLILTPKKQEVCSTDIGIIFNTHNNRKVACLWVLILVPVTIELPL